MASGKSQNEEVALSRPLMAVASVCLSFFEKHLSKNSGTEISQCCFLSITFMQFVASERPLSEQKSIDSNHECQAERGDPGEWE